MNNIDTGRRACTASGALAQMQGWDARSVGMAALGRLASLERGWFPTGRQKNGKPVLRCGTGGLNALELWLGRVHPLRHPTRASFAAPPLADAYYRRVGEVGKRLRQVADRRRQVEENRQWGNALLASMMRLPTFPFALRDPKAWWNRI